MLVEMLKLLYGKKDEETRNFHYASNRNEEEFYQNIIGMISDDIRTFPDIIHNFYSEEKRYNSFKNNQNDYDNTLSIIKISSRLGIDAELNENKYKFKVSNDEENEKLLKRIQNEVEEKALKNKTKEFADVIKRYEMAVTV